MKSNNKKVKLTAALLTLSISVSMFTGCGKTNTAEPAPSDNQPQQETLPPNDPVIGEGGGDIVAFRPSESGILPQEKYEYPYMGMNIALTQNLLDKMADRDVIMLSKEDYTSDNTINYAALYWYSLTEEQKNETATAFDPDAWLAGLAKIGVLGVYHADSVNELDTITGCTQHKELGKSADGTYVYYLSTADDADETLKKEVEQTKVSLTQMQELDFYMGKTAFSEGRTNAANIGDFNTTDINGKTYTSTLFNDYDLTLVNVFTTWCTSCIEEMPALEELKKEMAAKGINVVGIVYDAVNEAGKHEQSIIDTAKQLQKKAGLTFPLLMPDETEMNGRLKGIDGYPESFFVDKNGNIVGETYMGAHSFEEWKEIAEKELANLKGANE